MRTIITTVGTSLLTNRSDDRPWKGWNRNSGEYPQPEIVAEWVKTADPRKISAETHTWYKLGALENQKGVKERVVLIHSQTEDGKYCAERLEDYAKKNGLNVEWPSPCNTNPADKNKLEAAEHHRPKNWEKIVNDLSQSGYVRLIRYDKAGGNQKGIREANDNVTDLYVVIDDGTYVLSLRIETTAEKAGQRRLVLDHLRNKINKLL